MKLSKIKNCLDRSYGTFYTTKQESSTSTYEIGDNIYPCFYFIIYFLGSIYLRTIFFHKNQSQTKKNLLDLIKRRSKVHK